MLPAPGQGALGVQCRSDDERVLALLAAIDDPRARAETTAERMFLRALGAGCTAPVGAHAPRRPSRSQATDRSKERRACAWRRSSPARMVGRLVRVAGEGDPEEVGERLAREALAAGAGDILEAIRGAQPLVGRRIVITRPRDQVGPLAEALERLGATVLAVPLVDIEPIEDARPLDAALARLESYRWVVFTSANGVAGVRERLGERSLPEDRARGRGRPGDRRRGPDTRGRGGVRPRSFRRGGDRCRPRPAPGRAHPASAGRHRVAEPRGRASLSGRAGGRGRGLPHGRDRAVPRRR